MGDLPFDYAVYAPPRAARRHARLDVKQSEVYSCTPDSIYAKHIIDSYNMPMFIVGKNELYSPIICMPEKFVDYRDKLEFDQLCEVIAHASIVISQVSAITALAGFFGIPTHFLKAASETEEQHEKHIGGVVWPGQEILK
jgi:ADP-heptose:LPS heptosyltransferase